MAGMAWDPLQYLRFESERARPFHDLVNRIESRPKEVLLQPLGEKDVHLYRATSHRRGQARLGRMRLAEGGVGHAQRDQDLVLDQPLERPPRRIDRQALGPATFNFRM